MYHLLALTLAPLLYSGTVHARLGSCDVSNAKLQLPQDLMSAIDVNVDLEVVVDLVVNQTYTCSSGTYIPTTSYVEMYDASCQYLESSSQGTQYQGTSSHANTNHRIGCYHTVPDSTTNVTKYMIDWYCDSGTTFSLDAVFMESVTIATTSAPDASNNYPWVVEKGTWTNNECFAYRYYTHGGQPPTQCQSGSETTITFTAVAAVMERISSSHSFVASTSATAAAAAASSSSSSSAKKAAAINAAVSSDSSSSSSDSDDSKIQKLLNYAPIAIALLVILTILSFIALVISFVYVCRRRGGATPTRTVPAYHPIQLPRSRQAMMEESYQDETKRYDP